MKKQEILGKSDMINHILQFIFIFSSVFFAIWLSNRNETRKLKQIEKQAIAAVYLELQNNLNELEGAIPYHQQVLKSINEYSDSLSGGLIQMSEYRKPIDHLMGLLTRYNSSSVLLNYEIAGKLSFLYQLQAKGVENTFSKLADILVSKEIFMPEYVDPMINLTGFTFRELLGQEVFLAEMIQEMMDLLQENYNL